MKTLNKVFFIGYVAVDPVEKNFDNDTRCVNLVIKTRDFYGPQGGKKVDKNFHNCIMWNGICDRATELLQKGDLVHIIGHLKNKKVDMKDSKPIYKTEVVVEEWTKLATAQSLEDDNDD